MTKRLGGRHDAAAFVAALTNVMASDGEGGKATLVGVAADDWTL